MAFSALAEIAPALPCGEYIGSATSQRSQFFEPAYYRRRQRDNEVLAGRLPGLAVLDRDKPFCAGRFDWIAVRLCPLGRAIKIKMLPFGFCQFANTNTGCKLDFHG